MGPREVQPEHYRGGPHPCRIRIKAAAANLMDWGIRKGKLKMMTGSRFPRGLGHDFADVIDAVGPDVKRFKLGDEVLGATGLREAGSFAEMMAVGENSAFLKPPSVSSEQAAALTITGATAYTALITKGRVARGQDVFISGCMGGVGRAGAQLALMRVDITTHATTDPELVVTEFRYEMIVNGTTLITPCIWVRRVRNGRIVEARDYNGVPQPA